MPQAINTEEIISIPLSKLHSFPDHPFSVKDDASMESMVDSIKAGGILTPILVRPREGGDYEIVSGHRRRRACELAGVDTIPAILREMTREEAIITMVDSNLQREEILPSERAQAYKMKLEALRHQGQSGTESVVDFHHPVVAHAGRTRIVQPPDLLFSGGCSCSAEPLEEASAPG